MAAVAGADAQAADVDDRAVVVDAVAAAGVVAAVADAVADRAKAAARAPIGLKPPEFRGGTAARHGRRAPGFQKRRFMLYVSRVDRMLVVERHEGRWLLLTPDDLEACARALTGLDRRTVKKHVRAAHDAQGV